MTPLRALVWERGVGETSACGSGACAIVVALAGQGLIDRSATVQFAEGSLMIEWNADDDVLMTGAATTAFTGILCCAEAVTSEEP